MNRCVIVKSLIKCCLVVLALAASAPAQAQTLKMSGFAGEDKEVAFVNEDWTIVSLGTDDPNPDCEFFWQVLDAPEGAIYNIIDANTSQPRLALKKTNGRVLVEATRVSKYGYQREYVWVTVTSKIHIVSIENNKYCYTADETVEIGDFEIETSPKGFSNRVDVYEGDKEFDFWDFGAEDVRFHVKHLDDTEEEDEMTAEVFLVPDWAKLGGDLDALKDTINKAKVIEKIQDKKKELTGPFRKLGGYVLLIKRADKKLEQLKRLLYYLRNVSPPGAPIEPVDTISKEFEISLDLECCNDKPVIFANFNGSIDFYAGVEINMPLYPPYPKLGLQLVGEAGAGAKVAAELKASLPEYSDCFVGSIPFDVYGKCALGLKLMAFSDDILSAKASIWAEIHGESEATIVPELDFQFKGVYSQAGIKVEATFIGFNKEFVDEKFPKIYLIEGSEDNGDND